MKLAAISAVLCAAASAAAHADSAERAVTLGGNPVFSPDGARIAFQRLGGDVFKIGVVPVAGGEVEWIENGPGNAAYPAWTPDGALIYMAGNDTETAREAWANGSRSGYGLRIWRNGEKRDLTSGRCRDYTPCVSPDGNTVYFVTTRGVGSESASFSKAATTRLATLDIAKLTHSQLTHSPTPFPHILLDSPNGSNSGYVQPAVSPDGKFLIWGHLDSFFDSWRICGMRLASLTSCREGERAAPCREPNPSCREGERAAPHSRMITPSSLAALSPRWHPNGRMICFTGFRKGDPGWGVWVEDVHTGKVRRLATGENPCFSPDGASIAYDRGGTIFLRPFGPADEPDELLPDVRDDDAPEKTLLETGEIASETVTDISADSRFAFGDATPFFIRAKVRLDGATGVRQIAVGDYAENPRAFQLYVSGNEVWLTTRGFDGKWLGVKAKVEEVEKGEGQETKVGDLHSIVAARTAKRLVLSVDGDEPKTIMQGPFLPLDTPLRLVLGVGMKQGEVIESLEIGTGWPKELPRVPTREDLFK